MITVDEAIRVSRILAAAPEERIPMILSALEKADILINGLEELEEWKLFNGMAAIVDLEEFVAGIFEAFGKNEGTVRVPATEFTQYCKKQKLRPTQVKRVLAKKGYIRAATEGPKTEYTEAAWVDGKTIRCVTISRQADIIKTGGNKNEA